MPELHVKGLAISNFIALICNRKSAVAIAVSSSFDFIAQMYKVFVNHRAIYLAAYNDLKCICGNDEPIKCDDRNQVENAFSNFICKPSQDSLYLYNTGDSEILFIHFISLFSFIQAAGGLVRDPQNRFLFIHRLGVWDLPKGKIEKGEDPPTAALREVTEETGLQNLTILKPLPHTYHIFEREGKLKLKQTFWFEMVSSDDGPLCPQLEEDIIEVHWFGNDEIELPLSNTYPAILGLVAGYLSELM